MNRLACLMYIYSGCIFFFPHVIADRHCIDRKALISGLLIRAHTVDRYITYSTSSKTRYEHFKIIHCKYPVIFCSYFFLNHLAVVCLNILLQ